MWFFNEPYVFNIVCLFKSKQKFKAVYMIKPFIKRIIIVHVKVIQNQFKSITTIYEPKFNQKMQSKNIRKIK